MFRQNLIRVGIKLTLTDNEPPIGPRIPITAHVFTLKSVKLLFI